LADSKEEQLKESLLGLRHQNTQKISQPFADENLHNFDDSNSKDFRRYITLVGDPSNKLSQSGRGRTNSDFGERPVRDKLDPYAEDDREY